VKDDGSRHQRESRGRARSGEEWAAIPGLPAVSAAGQPVIGLELQLRARAAQVKLRERFFLRPSQARRWSRGFFGVGREHRSPDERRRTVIGHGAWRFQRGAKGSHEFRPPRREHRNPQVFRQCGSDERNVRAAAHGRDRGEIRRPNPVAGQRLMHDAHEFRQWTADLVLELGAGEADGAAESRQVG